MPVAAGAEAEVAAAGLVVWQHRVGVGLAFGGVGGGDGVDYGLGFFVADFWKRGGGLVVVVLERELEKGGDARW